MELSQDEGVNEFLQRIRELGDRRDREDDERTRKLEEEILAGRQARQARRAERAKSLSPTKDSPSGQSRTSRISLLDFGDIPKLEHPEQETSREDALQDALDRLTGANGDSGIVGESPPTDSTVPWQRRPTSSTGSPAGPWTKVGSPGAQLEVELSRSDISRTLEAKDISFFSQSSERKISSEALRKDAVQHMEGSRRTPLPGMADASGFGDGSAKNVPEPAKESQRPLSACGFANSTKPYSAANVSTRFDQLPLSREPKPLDDQARFVPMSPSQGRIFPERKDRTPSPTKGLGSFVQSAMLKRENSISKRWNPNSNVPRNNSSAATDNGYSTVRAREHAPSTASREPSPALEDSPKPESLEKEMLYRPRAKSIVGSLSGYSTSVALGAVKPDMSSSTKKDVTPPTSPSKTLDQKRWSPTKASWLEVALKKGTEGSPPLLKSVPSMDAPVRELPPKAPTKPLSYTRSHVPSKSITNVPPLAPSPPPTVGQGKPISAEKPVGMVKPIVPSLATKHPPPIANKPSNISSKPIPEAKDPLNFRANLRPREGSIASPEKEELPFLSAISRLKSTRTQNYVARDELKNQILAGKASLQASGGPQKTQFVDPLKEKIALAKVGLKHPSTISPADILSKQKPLLPPKQPSAPGRLEGDPKLTSIAGRVPNLANVLTKGPPSASGPRNFSSTTSSSGYSSSSMPEERDDTQTLDVPLIHITKTRAKGPKRRQPTKAPPAAGESAKGTSSAKDTPRKTSYGTPKRISSTNSDVSKTVPATPPKPSGLGTKSSNSEYKAPTVDDEPENQEEVKPPTPAKSPLLSAETGVKEDSSQGTPEKGQGFSLDSPQGNAPTPTISISAASTTALPRTLPWLRRPTPNIQSTQNAESGTIQNGNESILPNAQATLSKMPIPGELLEYLKPSRVSSSSPTVTSPLLRKVSSSASLLDDSGELSKFFSKNTAPILAFHDLDVSGYLQNKPIVKEKIETLKTDVWEVTADGNVQALLAEDGRILFNENMYLCLHCYATGCGDKTAEIYLWRGNNVSAATFDDAQLFAKKMAEESDAQLIFLQQGKETPEFFDAIGGIVITRHGNSQQAKAPYMLCARGVPGGVAFDEEDLNNSCLCSGFPFLIYTGKKYYLWKGRGSTLKELDAARSFVTAMSSGDFEEVEESQEPSGLLEVLPRGVDEKASADYWQLKPQHDDYAVRLFKFDEKLEDKVYEIIPFCQSDLDPATIYVLDAFFEIYIALGANSQSRKGEFHTALQFAQEYSKLSGSSGNRPYPPPIFVLLGGVSREFKAVFRSWELKHIPTPWATNRKPSLRVVGLEEAKRALDME